MHNKAWQAALDIVKASNLSIDFDDCTQADYVAKYFNRLYKALSLVEDGNYTDEQE